MNKELFNSYLDDQSLLAAPSIAELQQLVEHYPYFQTARLLYLKSLHENKSTSYPGELKVTAIYAGDRSVLFRLVKKTVRGNIAPQADARPQPTHATGDSFAPGPATKTYENLLVEHIAQDKPDPGTTLDALLDFDYVELAKTAEKFDVLEAIASTPDSIQPQIIEYLQAEAKKIEETEPKKSRFDLIDKFIEKNPRIVPKEILPTATYDLSVDSVKESEFISETLADIYIKQKKYEKAMQIYEKLTLKYPQKSIYFANSIEKLKDLMNNDK